jgi:hypothetical protein
MAGRARSKLTYANVMASVAVFIALGGASYAAVKLPQNSVGTKQLKKSAVTTQKIRNGAVTGAKVKLSTLGKVPSAANADHATGADSAIYSGRATYASAALSASSALNAEEAAKLGGKTSADFASRGSVFNPGFVKLSAGQTAMLGQSGPFTLTAGCQDAGGGEVDARLLVESSEAGSLVAWGANGDAAGTFATPMEFDLHQSAGPETGLGATFAVIAPSGAQLNGLLNFGVNEFGADCFVGASGVSSTG